MGHISLPILTVHCVTLATTATVQFRNIRDYENFEGIGVGVGEGGVGRGNKSGRGVID